MYMHYHYELGAMRERGHAKRWLGVLLLATLLLGVTYGALLYTVPRLVTVPFTDKADPNATARKIETSKPSRNTLYIPQLNIEVPLLIGGGADSLAQGAWQQDASKKIEEGDTVAVCAQAFSLESTPWQTRQRSPFYNLGRLDNGDQLVLDYKGHRYAYKVTHTGDELPPQDKKDTPGLIAYTCDASGQFDRVAVQAAMIGDAVKNKSQQNSLW